MLKYTIVSESRNIQLCFTAEQDLAKTHTIAVLVTYLGNNCSWTFNYKSGKLVTEVDVIEFAKHVCANRAKQFYTTAAKQLQKDMKEFQQLIIESHEFFDYQFKEFVPKNVSPELHQKCVCTRTLDIWQRSNSIVACLEAIISCL